MAVEAKIEGLKVKGQGFAELVGFPRQKKIAAIYQRRFTNEFMKNGIASEKKRNASLANLFDKLCHSIDDKFGLSKSIFLERN